LDIQEYIASGILELYATGLLSPTERLEVERMAAYYPQVRTELEVISDTLDSYVRLHAVEPHAGIKEKVLRSITYPEHKDYTVSEINSPFTITPVDLAGNPNGLASASYKNYKWWAMAASVLLLISAGFNFYFYKNWRNTQHQYHLAITSQNKYALQVRQVNQELQKFHSEINLISHSKTHRVNLKGVQKSPSSSVVVYWNTSTKDVLVKVANLPTPPANRQYQLWALENGKPVNAGILNLRDFTAVQHMKTIANAQAFAITLEPIGGSPNPTMEEMYVMGQF